MPKIAFGVQSSSARSKRESAGGCVNFIREYDGENLVLYRRPGFTSKTTLGDGPTRGAINANGTAYVVTGGDIYSMDTSYLGTYLGSLQTTSGRVSMSWDGQYVVVVDGSFVYTYDAASDVWTRNLDTDIFSNPTHVAFSDGFHFINDPVTGQIMTHETAYNPTGNWNALDYATAEFSPDQLKSIIADHANLFLLGETSTEPWEYDTNSSALPLQPIRAGYMEYGTVANFSPINYDNSVAWLARDKNGQGVMVRANGWTPQRISTSIEEAQWANYSDVTDAFTQVWWLEGHPLLILTFPTADKTWVYDSSAPEGVQWSEWQRGNADPLLRGRMRFQWSINLNGKTVCGDYEDNNVYEIDWDVHTDNGTSLHWSARTLEFVAEDEGRVPHARLNAYMEAGVGLTDVDALGGDPQVWLRYSDDHGENWTEKVNKSFGKKGEYDKRVYWPRLGSPRHRIYELYGSDPVTTVIKGGFLAHDA